MKVRNYEKCRWPKQMQAVDEKPDSGLIYIAIVNNEPHDMHDL